MERIARLACFAALATAAWLADAIPAAAGAGVPTLTAQRAAVYDPAAGAWLLHEAGNPAEAAMGSTAKIMTIHLALEAEKLGAVAFSDKLTISGKAAGQGCNCFAQFDDVQDGPLQAGDQMTLEDALYAVARSDGEPTVAVAEFVAKALIDGTKTPNATYEEAAYWEEQFEGVMNLQAAFLGLADTYFETPHGGDDPGQYTTVVDLALLWQSAAELHPRFLDFLGWWNRDLIVFHGGGPVGTPYAESNSHAYYPGVEGSKGGNSVWCQSCWIASAERIGRRLVASNMQSTDNQGDAAEQFGFGFATIFEPHTAGNPVASGAIKDHALACSGDDVIDVARSSLDQLVLRRWTADADAGTLAYAGGLSPGVGVVEVDVDRVNASYVTSFERRPAPIGVGGITTELELKSWRWNGPVPLLVDTEPAGRGAIPRVVRLRNDRVLTAHRTDAGARLKTWSVGQTGALQLLATIEVGTAVNELDVAADLTGTEAVVALRNPAGKLVFRSYSINDLTGALAFRDEEVRGSATSIRIAYVGSGWFGEMAHTEEAWALRYAASYIRSNGLQGLAFVRTTNGTLIHTGSWGSAGLWGTATAVTSIGGSGAVSAYQGLDGQLHLSVGDFPWAHPLEEVRADYKVAHDSGSPGGKASEVEVCSVNVESSTGAQVTAVRGSDGKLQLRVWREGDLP